MRLLRAWDEGYGIVSEELDWKETQDYSSH